MAPEMSVLSQLAAAGIAEKDAVEIDINLAATVALCFVFVIYSAYLCTPRLIRRVNDMDSVEKILCGIVLVACIAVMFFLLTSFLVTPMRFV